MKTQKPFPFARKTDRCVAIPDQLKNILYGLKLSSNLAKHLKDVYEKGIIPIQDEEAGEVKMWWEKKIFIMDGKISFCPFTELFQIFQKERTTFYANKTRDV